MNKAIVQAAPAGRSCARLYVCFVKFNCFFRKKWIQGSTKLGDFERELSDKNETVAGGCWSGEEMIGYSICVKSRTNPFPSVKFLKTIESELSEIWRDLGTVVHPDYQGCLSLRFDCSEELAKLSWDDFESRKQLFD